MADAWSQPGGPSGSVLCPQGHANSPSYRFCSVCGSPIGVVPFPEDIESTGSSGRRRLGWIIGAAAAVVVVVTGATTAVLLSRPSGDTSAAGAAGGFGTGTPAAVSAAPVCTEPPILETESFDLTDEGLVVGAALFSGCPGGDVEAGEAVRVTVADGERDIAAGEFDFSASPVEMRGACPSIARWCSRRACTGGHRTWSAASRRSWRIEVNAVRRLRSRRWLPSSGWWRLGRRSRNTAAWRSRQGGAQ